MKILGIDPGFGRLGYAIIEADKKNCRVIDCSCVETSPKLKYEKRLLFIAEKIKNLISENRPEAMALEKIFFTSNQKTAMQVSEVRGILIYLAASSHIPYFEYTPLEIKMALCGYGRATKDQIQKMLKILLKIEFLPKLDDASDALATALTCAVCLPGK